MLRTEIKDLVCILMHVPYILMHVPYILRHVPYSLYCFYYNQLMHTFIHSFIHLVVCLTKVQSLVQSELSTQCNLELPPSNESILSFPYGHPVASYVFFFVFLSLLPPFHLSFNNPLYKTVSTQNVTNPVILPFPYFM